MQNFIPVTKIAGMLTLTALMNVAGAGKTFAALPSDSSKSGKHSTIIISKNKLNKKYRVKIYSDAAQETIFFSASGDQAKLFQLYLFDLDGKLIKQTQIRNKETTLLSNVEKGDYMFEVFSDDERIQNGNVSVR